MDQLYQGSYWFRSIVGFGVLPVLLLAAAVLHLRTRRDSTLCALIGLLVALGGTIVQLLSPVLQ